MAKYFIRIFLLGGLSAVGLAGQPAQAADTGKQFEKISLAPGQDHEACAALGAAEKWRYAFTASAPLSFNLHYHADKKVYYPVPVRQTAVAKDLFTAASAQTYCLMWTNTAAQAVELNLEYEKLSDKQ